MNKYLLFATLTFLSATQLNCMNNNDKNNKAKTIAVGVTAGVLYGIYHYYGDSITAYFNNLYYGPSIPTPQSNDNPVTIEESPLHEEIQTDICLENTQKNEPNAQQELKEVLYNNEISINTATDKLREMTKKTTDLIADLIKNRKASEIFPDYDPNH